MKLSAAIFALAFCLQSVAGANYDDHHLLLDRSLSNTDAATSPYLFNQVQEALAFINRTECSPSDTITLSIAPGVYWVDDPDDPSVRTAKGGDHGTPYGAVIRCRNLRIEGLGSDPSEVVLASNRGQTQGALGNYTMFRIDGSYLETRNLTFGNYCNVDLDYKADPTQSRPKRAKAIVQAQLAHTSAAKVWADNCRFISRLNLCPITGGRRSLYTGCHFECTDDALQGSAVYKDCHFEFFSSKPWYSTPHWGAVLLDCQIDTHVTGTQYFCKADGGITLINVKFRSLGEDSPKLQATYGKSNDACYYSNVTMNGNPVSIAEGTDISQLPLLKAFNVLNLLQGDDQWDPLALRGQIAEDCLNLPTWMQISRSRRSLQAQGDTLTLAARIFHWDGHEAKAEEMQRMGSDYIRWQSATTARPTPSEGLTAIITSQNEFPRPSLVRPTASLSSGLMARSEFMVEPDLKPAPEFTQSPMLTFDRKQRALTVDYKISQTGTDDASLVTWYRYTREDRSDAFPVRHGSIKTEGTYVLTRGDKDYRIFCSVSPRFANSQTGEAQTVAWSEPISIKMMPTALFEETSYHTNFRNVPIADHVSSPGTWSFSARKPQEVAQYDWTVGEGPSWYYGKGVDGCSQYEGLVQRIRGAYCYYTPSRDKSGNMECIVKIDPAKTAGQGFGSATGQYMDLGIKYDPETLTGYALRIERQPLYDRAVVFTLVRYDHGQVTPISEPQASICYRSTCTVTLSLKGTTLTATAQSNASLPQPDQADLHTEVFLQAQVEKLPHSAFFIQHTGSVGGSASMIREVTLKW